LSKIITAKAEAQQYMLAEYERIAEEVPEEQQAQAFENLLNMRTDLAAQFFKIHALIAQGNYSEAQTLGNSLLVSINPKFPEYADYMDFLALLPLHKSLNESEDVTLNAEQKSALIAQLQEWKPATYGLALDILTQWSDFEHQEPLDYPESAPQPRSMNLASSSEYAIPAWITIYPNPASEFVSIRLFKAPLTSNASYKLTNSQGAIINQGKLDNPTMEYVVTLDQLAAGLYTLTVFDRGHVMHAQSIIVE
jgi:Secretion system C-terminal sorting domain